MRGDVVEESELLEAARAGDERAYASLVEEHRPALHAHCYRMLGSVPDAEDALQEALLGAWRGLPRFEGRSSLRTWLYTITTNACLKAIERRPSRVLPVDFGPAGSDPHGDLDEPLTESVWLEPYPDGRLGAGAHAPEARYEQREAVELAFVAALQHLPARQRAVLILRDVLGFSGAEVAATLEMSPEAVYSALQRAHRAVTERLPEQSQQVTLRALGDDAVATLAAKYVEAWERADVDAIVAMLTEDAVITMPPYRTWFAGRDTVAAFLRKVPLRGLNWRAIPSRANGQLGIALYRLSEETGRYDWHSMEVLTLRGDRIAEITAFLDPDSYRFFDMPAVLSQESSATGPGGRRTSSRRWTGC